MGYYGGGAGWYTGRSYYVPARRHRTSSAKPKGEKSDSKKQTGFGDMPKGPLQLVVSIGTQKVTLFSNGVRVAQGPISTGEKKSVEAQGRVQTVIEMTDGTTLDVDAAWEDKQGIWYRRSGLVSFVDSSRVKAITARRETKPAEDPHP